MSELSDQNIFHCPEGAKSIRVLYKTCLEGFQQLDHAFRNASISNPIAIPLEIQQQTRDNVREQLERFQMWAGNSGAHRNGKMSLDHRLREALHMQEQVIELLESLDTSLREALRIMIGDDNSDVNDECLGSDYSSSGEELNDPGLNALVDEEEPPSTTEFEFAFLDITHLIKCLYRFLTMLHQPMPLHRIQKCSSIDVKYYESWDIQHVGNKFPNLPEYLQQRLGLANTKRRQLLIYHERHHRKIALLGDKIEEKEDDVKPSDHDNQAPGAAETAAHINIIQPQKPVCGPGTTLSATTAKTFRVTPDLTKGKLHLKQALSEDCESDTGTQTSYASSHSVSSSYNLSVPYPQSFEDIDGEPFECPYCHDIILIENWQKSWKRHVFSDLMPYVCTFVHCPTPHQLYGSRYEWFEHELQLHRRQWRCEPCNETFSKKKLMMQHLRDSHVDEFAESEYSQVLKYCEEVNTTEQPCIICSPPKTEPMDPDQPPSMTYPIRQLRSHLGRHMQQLALFTLPRHEALNDKRDSNSDSGKASLGDSESLNNPSSVTGVVADFEFNNADDELDQEEDLVARSASGDELQKDQGSEPLDDTLNSNDVDLYTQDLESEEDSDRIDLYTQDLEPKEEEKQLYRKVTIEPQKTLPSNRKFDIHDLTEFMMKFVIQSGTARIFLQLDENEQYDAMKHEVQLRAVMRGEAETLSASPGGFPVFNLELIVYFVLMGLYDVLVLVDDSQSMEYEEQGLRIDALKDVLDYIGDMFAGMNKSIRAIRFLNNDDNYANNINGHDVGRIIDALSFGGLTKIGTALMQKVLKPFVFEEGCVWDKNLKRPRPLRKLYRPVLVIIIINRVPEGEPIENVPAAIHMVHESLQQAGFMFDNKAVVFQFAFVGNDPGGHKYLEYLAEHSQVKDFLDTMPYSELMKIVQLKKNSHGSSSSDIPETLQRRMLRLFLGPVLDIFRRDNGFDGDDFDEFDDDEEDGGWEAFLREQSVG